jgi:L-ascorbate metabolism protein UlaG (beta-lactamase superfamily)
MKKKASFLLILLLNIQLLSWAQQNKVELTYIANSGFLIEVNETKLVFDCLFNEGYGNYLIPEDTVVKNIIEGNNPFNGNHLMLITHAHQDHFNVSMVAKYLSNNPKNILVAPPLVIKSLFYASDYQNIKKQIVEIDKINRTNNNIVVGGVRIKSFFLQHDSRPQIENMAYLIEIDGVKIFHTGDCTAADTVEFKKLQLQNEKIDLAILNFYGYWWSNEDREFTKNFINPRNIVLSHIPPNEIDFVMDSVKKINNFIDISVFEKSMDSKSFTYFNQTK